MHLSTYMRTYAIIENDKNRLIITTRQVGPCTSLTRGWSYGPTPYAFRRPSRVEGGTGTVVWPEIAENTDVKSACVEEWMYN